MACSIREQLGSFRGATGRLDYIVCVCVCACVYFNAFCQQVVQEKAAKIDVWLIRTGRPPGGINVELHLLSSFFPSPRLVQS